ncbi:jg22520, partial [Pararge aegeria aegeria]
VGARSAVAVKCIDKCRVKHSGAAIDNLVSEIRLLKTLSHPHIVQMKEFTWDDRYCSLGVRSARSQSRRAAYTVPIFSDSSDCQV